MKLMQLGPETNTIGDLVSELITESNNLEDLKTKGLNIASKMDKSDAMWCTAQMPLKDATKWHLYISETCSLHIYE